MSLFAVVLIASMAALSCLLMARTVFLVKGLSTTVSQRLQSSAAALADPKPSPTGAISSIGFTSWGALLECANGRRLTLEQNERTADLYLDSNIITVDFDRLNGFGCHPQADAKSFLVYADAVDSGRIALGIWEGRERYNDLLGWIDSANLIIGARTSQSETQVNILHRILEAGHLTWLPGRSMSAVGGTPMGAYKPGWAPAVPQVLSQLISGGYPHTAPIHVEEASWPELWTWERVYDSIVHPQVYSSTEGFRPDLCLEFLYLDSQRATRYDIVRVGEIRTFKMLVHRRNTRLAAFLAAMSQADGLGARGLMSAEAIAKNRWSFPAFRHALVNVGVELEFLEGGAGGPWTLCTTAATIAANLLNDLVAQAEIPSGYLELVDTTLKCSERLRDNRFGTVALCDTVIAAEVISLFSHLGLRLSEFELLTICYPTPVPIGFVVPPSQSEWKALLHASLYQVVRSRTCAVAWKETVDELSKIDAVVDADLDPNTWERGITYDHAALATEERSVGALGDGAGGAAP
jgi:hypothetical protein